MDRCQTKVRPHKINGIEIELIGDCGGLVDEIMKNLGHYGQQYIKRRMVFVEKETEPTSQSDSSE
jgi:hypothetical protein